jgi:hypothetical protein
MTESGSKESEGEEDLAALTASRLSTGPKSLGCRARQFLLFFLLRLDCKVM